MDKLLIVSMKYILGINIQCFKEPFSERKFFATTFQTAHPPRL